MVAWASGSRIVRDVGGCAYWWYVVSTRTLYADKNKKQMNALDVPARTDHTAATTHAVPEAGRFGREGEGWIAERQTVMTMKQGR